MADRSQDRVAQTELPSPADRRELTKDEHIQEVDVWWGSYAGRTMVPELVLCGLLTAVVFILAWWFKNWHGNIGRYLAQITMGALWLVELARWTYRLSAVNYRLTTRRLLYCWGFYRPDRWEVDLSQVARVTVEQNSLERLLGVGQIRIETDEHDAAPRVFEGVKDPAPIAREIEKRVRLAQDQA